MHEISIAQALLDQIEAAARPRNAVRVDSATISVGPLSGVEPDLLLRAFEVARRMRPVTADTVLKFQACSGDELLLLRVEMDVPAIADS